MTTWYKQVQEAYIDAISHAFILYGNTRDFVETHNPTYPYVELMHYVQLMVEQSVDIIITFDPATGAVIPIPLHQERLAQLLKNANLPPSAILGEWKKGTEQVGNPAMYSLRDVTLALDWLFRNKLVLPKNKEITSDTKPQQCRIGLIINFIEYVLPDGDLATSGRIDTSALTRIIRWAQDIEIGNSHQLYMVGETLSSIHTEVRRASARWEAIEIPLPNETQREAFIQYSATNQQLELTDDEISFLARSSGGLSLKQLEDILLRAGRVGLTPQIIEERKKRIISQEFAGIIQVSQPRRTMDDVAGYDYIKDFLTTRVVKAWQQGVLRMGGILMSGPPGTGKTHLAEALAGSAGVVFVEFRLANILGQYVGNSERNLERAITAIRSLAPVIVFIDEIDQILQRGTTSDGGNEVYKRIFARLLEFMEDPSRRGKILFIAATNRPDLLDPALVSRFDRTVPVLPPTDTDRMAIFQAQAALANIPFELDPHTEQILMNQTHLWTGRSIRDFVQVLAEDSLDETVDRKLITDLLASYKPPLRDISEMTRKALEHITDLRLVPPEFRPTEEPLDAEPVPTPSGLRTRRKVRNNDND